MPNPTKANQASLDPAKDDSSNSTKVPTRAVPKAGEPLQRIHQVRFVQNAAVSAYIIVYWVDSSGRLQSKGLGYAMPIGTEAKFNLTTEGVPDGSAVNFASYVYLVGEYHNNQWFTLDGSVLRGAGFMQNGSAIQGEFRFTGLYNT